MSTCLESNGAATPLDGVQRTIVECLGVAYPNACRGGAAPLADGGHQGEPVKPLTPENGGEAIVASEAQRQEVTAAIEKIIRVALADADCLIAHLDHLAEQLSAINCTSKADVEHYFRAANQTLASLYFLAAQPQPSPDGLKRLALRYALDARRPVEGDLWRFEWRRLEGGWEVTEYPSLAARTLPFRLPGRVLRDVDTVTVLDHVFARPPQFYDLMDFIEDRFGRVPTEADCLGPNGSVGVTPQRHEVTVDLVQNVVWIDKAPFPVRAAQAYLVDAIVAARGEWMSIKELASENHRLMIGPRPDRVHKV